MVYAEERKSDHESCIRLSHIIFQSHKLSPQGVSLDGLFIRDLNKKYRGKCINSDLIKEVMREATNECVKDGLVTSRIRIPEQDISSGKLILTLVHGRIEKIIDSDGNEIKDYGVPIQPDKILNIRDIEQTVDLYGRLKSNDTSFKLLPGSTEGESVIELSNQKKKKWYFSHGVDNSGSKSKGVLQQYSILSLEDVLNLKDKTSITYKESAGKDSERYQSYLGLNFTVPFDYLLFELDYNKNDYKHYIKTSRKSYVLKGGSWSGMIAFHYTVHRDSLSKTVIKTALGYIDYSNFLANNKIDISTYKFRKTELGIQHQRILWGNVFSVGCDILHGKRADGGELSPAKLKFQSEFAKLTYNMSLIRPLKVKILEYPLSYSLQIAGQKSFSHLVGSEKGTVGGLSSVRGFQEYTENADDTVVVRNELSCKFSSIYSDKYSDLFGVPTIFTSYDVGTFSNREENGYRNGRMMGISTGIRNQGGYLHYDLTIARPIESARQYKTWADTVVYFNLRVDI